MEFKNGKFLGFIVKTNRTKVLMKTFHCLDFLFEYWIAIPNKV